MRGREQARPRTRPPGSRHPDREEPQSLLAASLGLGVRRAVLRPAVEAAKEIKRALAYFLNNSRKHRLWSSPTQPDPFSSGRWYSAWYGLEEICRPLRAPPVARARDMYLMMPSFRSLGVDFVPGQRAWGEPHDAPAL